MWVSLIFFHIGALPRIDGLLSKRKKCCKCKMMFPTYALQKHIGRMHGYGSKRFPCKICNKPVKRAN